MNEFLQIIVPALIALACTSWIHPYILKVAKVKKKVNTPTVIDFTMEDASSSTPPPSP